MVVKKSYAGTLGSKGIKNRRSKREKELVNSKENQRKWKIRRARN